MKGYLYILKSEKLDRYYIGSSDNPSRRLNNQHNKGFVKSTKSGIPWKIVFQQEYVDLIMARKIEYKLKTYKSRKIIEKIIQNKNCVVKLVRAVR
ncbi:MAG: GIY-YIG nuclease family protein [Candidatus Shapirobacteria bacterium]|nr:GIY-YIG nuclease family protein [Candidatus Shapirobacteria bacterium]